MCELLFWFRKFIKCSVEYYMIVVRYLVEVYMLVKSDLLRNFYKFLLEKM